MILSLEGIGWVPRRPDEWFDELGEKWSLEDAMERHIDKALWRAQEAQLVQRMKQREVHKGIDQGVDWRAGKLLCQRWRRNGMFREAKMLEAVQVDGVWTQQRRYNAGYEVSPVCTRGIIWVPIPRPSSETPALSLCRR